jgi:hypothetical protein
VVGQVLRKAIRLPSACLKTDAYRQLCSLQIIGRGLAGARILNEVETDLLPFRERPQARPFDGGDMDENVLSIAVRLNEAEALGGIEELYGSLHDDFLSNRKSWKITQGIPYAASHMIRF